MKVKGDKVYFEADDYELAKELLNKHIVIHADGTGPFGEDEGAHVSGMDVDYADNIENYDSLEGKDWDDLDDEEKEWFDGEDDFEQLNPFWANDIVCIDKDLGQSGINWCDWEMIFADLWIKKEDYDKVNKVHTVHYDMEVESTKHRRTGMLLSEAKEILKKNGFIVEDAMHDRAMARVNRANARSMKNGAEDTLKLYKAGEDWEEGGHAEWMQSEKELSDAEETSDFKADVLEQLLQHYLPIYAKKGFTKAAYVKENGKDGADDWNWTIVDILGDVYSYVLSKDKKFNQQVDFMSVDEAVHYLIPTANKVLAICWEKHKTGNSWFNPYKFNLRWLA